MKKKSNKKISGKELTWYIISGVFALAGLGFLVTGIVGDNLGVVLEDNPIKAAETAWMEASHITLSYRWIGVIFLAIALILVVSTLCFNAKKTDREAEKKLRRTQRLSNIIDAESQTVENAPTEN